jgi:hypothetical protein
MAQTPDRFPILDRIGITVVFGTAEPVLEGYDATTAILEVLVDVGMIADERLVEWGRTRADQGPSVPVTCQPSGSRSTTHVCQVPARFPR